MGDAVHEEAPEIKNTLEDKQRETLNEDLTKEKSAVGDALHEEDAEIKNTFEDKQQDPLNEDMEKASSLIVAMVTHKEMADEKQNVHKRNLNSWGYVKTTQSCVVKSIQVVVHTNKKKH